MTGVGKQRFDVPERIFSVLLATGRVYEEIERFSGLVGVTHGRDGLNESIFKRSDSSEAANVESWVFTFE